jgi:transposase
LIARIHPKNGNLIEKTVSERTTKLSRRNDFSPFFLPPCSVLINKRGRRWRQVEHWSMGCDIIDRAFNQKMAI